MKDHCTEHTLTLLEQWDLKDLHEINNRMCLSQLLKVRMKNNVRFKIRIYQMAVDLEAYFHFNTIIFLMVLKSFTSTKDIILILLKTSHLKEMINWNQQLNLRTQMYGIHLHRNTNQQKKLELNLLRGSVVQLHRIRNYSTILLKKHQLRIKAHHRSLFQGKLLSVTNEIMTNLGCLQKRKRNKLLHF